MTFSPLVQQLGDVPRVEQDPLLVRGPAGRELLVGGAAPLIRSSTTPQNVARRRARTGAAGSVNPVRSSIAGPSTGSEPPIGLASSSAGSTDASTTSCSLHADQPAAVAMRTA